MLLDAAFGRSAAVEVNSATYLLFLGWLATRDLADQRAVPPAWVAPTDHSTGERTRMSDTETWAQRYLAAWGTGDPDEIMAWMADDATFVDVPSNHTVDGAPAVREFVESALLKAPGITFQVESSVVTDDAFTIEWLMQPVGLRGASVGKHRDGLITLNRDYWSAGLPTAGA